MELFNLYQSFFTTAFMFGGVGNITSKTIILCAVCAVLIWVGLFAMQGVGLATMAKNRGIGKTWMAYVPFANLLYLGRIAGDCEVFGHKMKKPGLYAMITQIAATIVFAMISVAETLLFTIYAPNLTINSTTGTIVWTGLTGFAEMVNVFYNTWGDLLCSVIGLVYELLVFLMMMSLLKKYYAKGYMLLSFTQLFIPISRYVMVFVLRKNKAIDYNEYMRKKYQEYARRNPYGDPYGYGSPYGNNPYNRPPYGQNPYGQNGPYGAPRGGQGNQTNNTPDPFAEFSSQKNEDPFSDIENYGEAKKSEPFSDVVEEQTEDSTNE